MINRIKTLATLALFCGFIGQTMAQDTQTDSHTLNISVPEVILLDIEPSENTLVSIAPEAPEEAGEALDFTNATDNSLWLNYSSIVDPDEKRTVTVGITAGEVPAGLLLKVTAAADAGNGDGIVGTPSSTLTLSSTAQNIITNIGSCYTNSPENNGHQLTYDLEEAENGYGSLEVKDVDLTITYTLTDI
ncbi:MAG: hypothetical protein AB8G22_07635 [Saprospiraceae bacterium]